MPDPRIERTRTHVLSVARSMLGEKSGEPLTFSRLAEQAQVSRRTLYTHWGTVENVIAEAVAFHDDDESLDTTGLTPRQILRELLVAARERILNPVTHVALTTLVAQAAMDAKAADALSVLGTARLEDYEKLLGPITHQQYSQIVGPLFFSSTVLQEELTDDFVDELVECGVELLGLSEA